MTASPPPRLRGRALQRQRAAMAKTLPCPCYRCGQMVEQWQRWHIDHVTPVAHGGANGPVTISHAWCNMSAGGGKVRRSRNAAPSRQW